MTTDKQHLPAVDNGRLTDQEIKQAPNQIQHARNHSGEDGAEGLDRGEERVEQGLEDAEDGGDEVLERFEDARHLSRFPFPFFFGGKGFGGGEVELELELELVVKWGSGEVVKW